MQRFALFVLSLNACTALTVPGCVPLPAVMGEYGEAALSAQDTEAVAQAIRRGQAIHRQDQLAWHASDFAQEKKLISRKTAPTGFFSVAGEGREGSTYFVLPPKAGKLPYLRIDSDTDGQLTATPIQDDLPDDLRPRWLAVQAARQDKRLRLCSERANTAVLPDETGNGWLVYVMSATMNERQTFLGGHNRLQVSADGRSLGAIEHSAKSCIAFDAVELRGMGQKRGFFLSHLVSPHPWETDVLQSLTFAVPLTRVTSSGIWRIEGDAMRKYRTTPDPAATTSTP